MAGGEPKKSKGYNHFPSLVSSVKKHMANPSVLGILALISGLVGLGMLNSFQLSLDLIIPLLFAYFLYYA